MQPEGNRRRPQRVVGLCALVQSDVRVRSCVCTIVRTGAHVCVLIVRTRRARIRTVWQAFARGTWLASRLMHFVIGPTARPTASSAAARPFSMATDAWLPITLRPSSHGAMRRGEGREKETHTVPAFIFDY